MDEGNIFWMLFKYLYMGLIACVWLSAILIFLALPFILVKAFIEGWKGKGGGGLSDSFITWWSAHSDDSE